MPGSLAFAVSRIERLVNLTAALLAAQRPLSADDLKSRVPGYPDEKNGFRRQFERDKEVLRDLGLPLVTVVLASEVGESQVGYRIPADAYYLRDPGLDPDELSALHLATRIVQLDGLVGADAAWKLGPEANIDATVAVSATIPGSDALAALFAAIAAGAAVAFTYRDEQRTVQPARLTFRNGHWYVAGHDASRNADRSFRVDRIESGIQQRVAFVDVPAPAVAGRAAFGRPWELGDADTVETTIRIDAGQAVWALAHLGSDALVSRGDDGSCVVRLLVRNEDALRSFVLGFLDHAELIAPPYLRAQITEWLQQQLETATP